MLSFSFIGTSVWILIYVCLELLFGILTQCGYWLITDDSTCSRTALKIVRIYWTPKEMETFFWLTEILSAYQEKLYTVKLERLHIHKETIKLGSQILRRTYCFPPHVWRKKTIKPSLCASFWVIPRRLNFLCRRFGTLCLFHLHRWVGTYPPVKMEQTEYSERLAYKIQTPGNYPEESI